MGSEKEQITSFNNILRNLGNECQTRTVGTLNLNSKVYKKNFIQNFDTDEQLIRTKVAAKKEATLLLLITMT